MNFVLGRFEGWSEVEFALPRVGPMTADQVGTKTGCPSELRGAHRRVSLCVPDRVEDVPGYHHDGAGLEPDGIRTR
ncbi:hypothetical protein [Kitasatospora terrestris]|uniref:hypothetical protein n=1 Tax=Kitasatospora terrestris TaxID=258051 RepID=UPI0031E68DF1